MAMWDGTGAKIMTDIEIAAIAKKIIENAEESGLKVVAITNSYPTGTAACGVGFAFALGAILAVFFVGGLVTIIDWLM